MLTCKYEFFIQRVNLIKFRVAMLPHIQYIFLQLLQETARRQT